MIDIRLLASMAIVLAVPSFFVRPWPAGAVAAGTLDTTLGALGVGLIVGRLSALAIDDPHSLTSLSDLLIIRSGVEFWPGLLAGVAWLAYQARRDRVPVPLRIAALAPAALVAWACYEATCLLRDGCPGPASSIGLRPQGLFTRVFPVGLVVALAAAVAALLVDRLHRRGLPAVQAIVLAIAATSAIRSVASIWLPHIGDGLTRQHRTSMAVTAVSVVVLVTLRLRSHRSVATAEAT